MQSESRLCKHFFFRRVALTEQLERERLALLDHKTQKIDHEVEDGIEMGDDN
jgi:hypothetical protein